jgi:phage-related protein
VDVRIYADARGREPVAEYLRRIARAGEESAVGTAERYVDLLEAHGPNLGMPIDRVLDSRAGLYELRPGDHRIAYGVVGETIYLLEAWRKQQRRAPERAVNRARRLLLELRRAGAS